MLESGNWNTILSLEDRTARNAAGPLARSNGEAMEMEQKTREGWGFIKEHIKEFAPESSKGGCL